MVLKNPDRLPVRCRREKIVMSRIRAMLPYLLLVQLVLPTACTSLKVSMPALVLDGPALHIAGVYAGMSLEGVMDRGCMAGIGTLNLRAVNVAGEGTAEPAAEPGKAEDTAATAFVCSGKVDTLPDRKARVNGTLECSSGRRMAFSLRNLGPDQGLGIARESQKGDLMVFFYHAAESEAKRRLPQILAEMETVRAAAGKQPLR
jgi:hypothetical protein